jgi:hypothetical protein
MVKNEKGVWYKHTVIACPMCGREKHYRERMPAPAPPLKWGRYRGIEYIEAWDYCDAL